MGEGRKKRKRYGNLSSMRLLSLVFWGTLGEFNKGPNPPSWTLISGRFWGIACVVKPENSIDNVRWFFSHKVLSHHSSDEESHVFPTCPGQLHITDSFCHLWLLTWKLQLWGSDEGGGCFPSASTSPLRELSVEALKSWGGCCTMPRGTGNLYMLGCHSSSWTPHQETL